MLMHVMRLGFARVDQRLVLAMLLHDIPRVAMVARHALRILGRALLGVGDDLV